MKILYRQTDSPPSAALAALGIEQCYLKEIQLKKDRTQVTRKSHHHLGVELHIIDEGHQIYEVGDVSYRVSAGQFLLIPSCVRHKAIGEDRATVKHAITFSVREDSRIAVTLRELSVTSGETPETVASALYTISREMQSSEPYSEAIVAGRVLECIISVLRTVGITRTLQDRPEVDGDPRCQMAKQYVSDNILRPITLTELASYCCVSPKQLTRIFKREEGVAVAEYIRKRRTRHIEQLLTETNLTLAEISERMSFGSEYHFNSFFKRYAGMSPGAYRRSVIGSQGDK